MNKQRIIAVHLSKGPHENSFPFRQSLEVLKDENEIHLFKGVNSAKGNHGSFSNVKEHYFHYRWGRNKTLNFLFLLFSQTVVFFKLSFFLKKEDTVYINTLLPFGAALAARLKKCKLVYHVQEVNNCTVPFSKLLCSIADNTASRIIFNTSYAAQSYPFKKAKTTVVYNVLPLSFSLPAADIISPNIRTPFTVSMFSPLKSGRGIYEFVRIAAKMPRIRFILVLDAPAKERDLFIKKAAPASNCIIMAAPQDTLSIFTKSHLVVNLSKSKECVGSYDISILRALSCGRPVIVPPAGSVSELIDHGVEGFCLDATNKINIIMAINRLSSDIRMYNCFAAAARERSLYYSRQKFARVILEIVGSKKPVAPFIKENLLQSV